MNQNLMRAIEARATELKTLIELIPHQDTKKSCELINQAVSMAGDVISRTDLVKMQMWAKLLLEVTTAL